MKFRTILRIYKQNQLTLLRIIFEQNGINYRFRKESDNFNFPLGVSVQVDERHWEKAQLVLRENGFLNESESSMDKNSMLKFWLWLFFALLMVIIVSVLINSWRE
jgi:hypothetical protein